MFDIGISELGLIAVVALIVIGPERLPRVARMIGTLLGRAQRYVNDVKAEVNREIELEELRKLQTEMQDAARGIQQQVTTAGAEMQSAVHDMEKQMQEGVHAAVATPASESSAPPALAEPSSWASASELTEPPGTPPYETPPAMSGDGMPATVAATEPAPEPSKPAAVLERTVAAADLPAASGPPAAPPPPVAAKPEGEPGKPVQPSLFP